MTVRLIDISRDTGLSIPSISQIISGRGHYHVDTVARVLAAAERLGYRPNAAARTMVERRFRAFGLLLTCKTQLMVRGLWLMVSSTEHATIFAGTLLVYG